MTKTLTIATLAIAGGLLALSAGAMAATALVERTPPALAPGALPALSGFTVMSPALVGGPSATDYYAYYDSDGPNLAGIIRSYDDYSRYADARGVAAASILDASVLPQTVDDPLLTKLYGQFDYLFSGSAPRDGELV